MVFPLVMYGCESCTIKKAELQKNCCSWTVVLEKTLESPLDCKVMQLVHPEDQSWVFIGRTDVEAETPIFWSRDVKGQLIWKDPDAGKDWGQKKGMRRVRWLDGIINSMNTRPGVLRFMGSQKVWHDWVTELTWTEYMRGRDVIVCR